MVVGFAVAVAGVLFAGVLFAGVLSLSLTAGAAAGRTQRRR